jgi:cytoskeletal protein RodZ
VTRYDPPGYGYGGNAGGREPQPDRVPWWRRPAALVGLGVLIAILIGLIIFAVIQLTQGGQTAPVPTTTSSTTSTTVPPSHHHHLPTHTTTTTPTAASTTTSTAASPSGTNTCNQT